MAAKDVKAGYGQGRNGSEKTDALVFHGVCEF
jgi:hypothetical protein